MPVPQGWDEIEPETLEMAKTLREMYIAFLAVGFTETQAFKIIAQMWFALGSAAIENGSVDEGK